MVSDISRNPTIPIYTKQIRTENPKGNQIDSIPKEEITRKFDQIPNPKIGFIKPIDDRITSLRAEKSNKETMLLTLRPAVEAELKAKTGFLDELNLMFDNFSRFFHCTHCLADLVCFVVGLELFILVSKWNEHETDYDKMLEMQMALHFRRIELLSKQ